MEITEELDKRNKENLGETFIPCGKGDQFIQLIGKNETFINLFCAANGVGKSATGANLVTNICFGPQPFDVERSRWKDEWGKPPQSFFNHPLFQDFPYLKRGRIISDPTTIKEKIVPELKQWFPSNRYNVRYGTSKEGKNYESKWETDTGFVFDIMSSEQQPKEFESTDLGWVWIDEPLSRAIYLATIARLRRGGILFWTLTPLTYSAWIKDEIYDKRDGKMIDYVTADVWENCADRPGTRGILLEKDIERMISQYPEDEKEARIHGKFGHLLGLVHKGFEPKVHVVQPFDIKPEDYTVYMALDTHPRTPEAVLWMAVDNKGRKFIIDEMAFTGTDVQIAAEIKHRESNWNMQGRLIDPSAYNEDTRSNEESYACRLQKQGLLFKKGSKHLHECIRRTDEAFNYQMVGGQFVKEPEVFIFSNCQGLVRELQHYVWDEYSGASADKKKPKPNPVDKDDHFIECLHRLLIENNYRFIPYEKPKYKPLAVKRAGKRTVNSLMRKHGTV